MRVFKHILVFATIFFISCAECQGETAKENTGILLVAFGSSLESARAAFDTIDKAYQKEFPGVPIVWAFTSQKIRKKLAKQGIKIGGIANGLDELAKDGVKIVRIQSLHVMAGEEFTALARAALIYVKKHPDYFKAVYLGRPLLDSNQDAEMAVKAITSSLASRRNPKTAIILMGHGNKSGQADLVFEGTRSIFENKDPLIFMATVEGSRGFDELKRDLHEKALDKLVLMPLMVVSGDHAQNDLAGSTQDSWASQLKALGYNVQTNLQGLGEIPGIPQIFIKHTLESQDDLLREPRKP